VGTLDSYHQAHMELLVAEPTFSLHNRQWPILTWLDPAPPARFVTSEGVDGRAVDSLVCGGAVVSGANVRRSVLSPDVTVHSQADIDGSVLMHGVEVGRHAVVRNAVLDKFVRIPEGARIGVDLAMDRQRFVVSDGGIVVVGKGQRVQ
jgi:glucose-1-phosphate adenylyltransferase